MKTIPIPPFLVALMLVLACIVGVVSKVQALSPSPDGCYPNFTTAEGCDALSLLTTGAANTGLGWRSLFSISSGNFNTGVGAGALVLNNADSNTAVGAAALLLSTTGRENVAVGTGALVNNDTGNSNTAVGFEALSSNVIGVSNTAIGWNALAANTSGNSNTAVGLNTLVANTTGFENAVVGGGALASNTNGSDNTAIGHFALEENTTGEENTAVGDSALLANTTGSNNIALGRTAGSNLSTGNFNIDIGNSGNSNESQTIRVGSPGIQVTTYIAGIFNATVSGGTPVYIKSNGQLGTSTSSARFKEAIKPMDSASEVILALKPVTFRYKHELDPAGTAQFGLVAEEVEKVNPDLVARDDRGKPYTVRYDAVNAMLLNEFLKEHKAFVTEQHKVRELEVNAARQEANLARQQKQIEALTAVVQKVSAQLEVSKPAPQTVLINR
jgi:hypothetical protein